MLPKKDSKMPNANFIDDCEQLAELAPVTSAPIQHHVFVCTGKSCSAVESAAVKAAFERELQARGLQFGSEKKGRNPKGTIVLTECGSVGFCAIGAAVMVYPDGVWYAQVRPSDVPEIVESHLLNGLPVSRLALLMDPSQGRTADGKDGDLGNWDA